MELRFNRSFWQMKRFPKDAVFPMRFVFPMKSVFNEIVFSMKLSFQES